MQAAAHRLVVEKADALQRLPDAHWFAIFAVVVALVLVVQQYFERRDRRNARLDAENEFTVLIVGAGISGIASAFYCKQKNIPFVIIEKNPVVGGTWFTQRFHGVRFDSVHIQTLFSFAPMMCDPMCPGEQFEQYLIKVARDFFIEKHIRFEETVDSINFDSGTKMWTVKTDKQEYTVNYVMNCNGYYDHDHPNVPDMFKNTPFKGRVVHSMEIDQSKDDFAGQNIAIIGSGATAATMVPHLAKIASSVSMIQRSPGYIIKADWGQYPGYATAVKLHGRGVPWMWDIYRLFVVVVYDWLMALLIHFTPRRVHRMLQRVQLTHYGKVDPKAVEKHFAPRYDLADQRPLVSIGLLEALPKVHMVTGKTTGLCADGVVLDDGTTVKADTVILATGFNLDYFKFKVLLDGKEQNMYDRVLHRDVFFEGVPNFVNMVLFARLSSKHYTCFTPLLEHTADLVTDIIVKMRREKLRAMQIKPTQGPEPPRFFPMSSGYFKRNPDKCFKADAKEHTSLGAAWHIIFGYKFNPTEYVFE